jgi:hypothetical protein
MATRSRPKDDWAFFRMFVVAMAVVIVVVWIPLGLFVWWLL